MRTVNKITLVGRLGRDPEIRESKAGMPWGTLAVATNRNRKKNNEWVEETDWHSVRIFGSTAEYAKKSLKKGALVHVAGVVAYEKYTDPQGEKHVTARILADEVNLLVQPTPRAVEVDEPAATEAATAPAPTTFEGEPAEAK
jgi:single-strand DNA-binding protein